MNTLIKIMLFTLIPLVWANATCTKDEAYNKMMILGAEGAKRMHAYMKNKNAKVRLISDYVTRVSPYMEREEYSKACAIYDEVAKEYGIDFNKDKKITMTMKEIKEDGGKKGGECNLGDAALRFLNVSNTLLARGLAKTLEKDTMYHKASEEMTLHPSLSCELSQKLADKYHVSYEIMMKQPQYKNEK